MRLSEVIVHPWPWYGFVYFLSGFYLIIFRVNYGVYVILIIYSAMIYAYMSYIFVWLRLRNSCFSNGLVCLVHEPSSLFVHLKGGSPRGTGSLICRHGAWV